MNQQIEQEPKGKTKQLEVNKENDNSSLAVREALSKEENDKYIVDGVKVDFNRTVGHWNGALYEPMTRHHLARFLKCLNGVDPTKVVPEATPEKINDMFRKGAIAEAELALKAAKNFPESSRYYVPQIHKVLKSVEKYGINLGLADIGTTEAETEALLSQHQSSPYKQAA